MSWIEKVNRKISFFMGDGKYYYPEYLNAQKVQEFNVSVFNFTDIDGSLVQRKKPMGRKFKIEIYFQGPDCIDTAAAFEESAKDPRHWHIQHPLYENIRCQPLSLTYDDSVNNVTKITGTVIETILGVYPEGLIEPLDAAINSKAESDSVSVFKFANTSNLNGDDAKNMFATVDILEGNVLKDTDINTDLSEYLNIVRRARAAISKATSDGLNAMENIKEVINAPLLLNLGTFATQRVLLRQIESLSLTILGKNPDGSSVTARKYFETVSAIALSALFLNSVDNVGNVYQSRIAVIDNIDVMIEQNNNYLSALDELQLSDFTQDDIYIPDYDSMEAYNNMFSTVIGNLYQIATEAKQEKIITLSSDTNIINLTSRLYGLKPDDADDNINFLIETNSIGLNEKLILKKGREIKYYV